MGSVSVIDGWYYSGAESFIRNQRWYVLVIKNACEHVAECDCLGGTVQFTALSSATEGHYFEHLVAFI